MKLLDPITPGEMLLEEFIKPLGISQKKLAETIGVPPSHINDIIKGRRRISADMAIRLGKAFRMTDQFWMNLQNHYDLEVARQSGVADVKIDPLVAA
ncbi:MAG: HigA family addiction module antitoxin [Ahrensia sp.]|nr:HigA family addiction module antitoxin [Ahrensia sp.]